MSLCPFLFCTEGVEHMREKRTVSSWYKRKFCNKCIWQNNGLCPFLRCPKVKGWVADKNVSEVRENDEKLGG
jgi:hypothetical protein